MSTTQPKPSSYINVVADLNFLQRIVCCNHNIGNTPADTPGSRSLVKEVQQELTSEPTETIHVDPEP